MFTVLIGDGGAGLRVRIEIQTLRRRVVNPLRQPAVERGNLKTIFTTSRTTSIMSTSITTDVYTLIRDHEYSRAISLLEVR